MSYYPAAPLFSIPTAGIPELSLPGWLLQVIYSHGVIYALSTEKNIYEEARRLIYDRTTRITDIAASSRVVVIDTDTVRRIETEIESEERMVIVTDRSKNKIIKYKDVVSGAEGKSRTLTIVSDTRTTGVQ